MDKLVEFNGDTASVGKKNQFVYTVKKYPFNHIFLIITISLYSCTALPMYVTEPGFELSSPSKAFKHKYRISAVLTKLIEKFLFCRKISCYYFNVAHLWPVLGFSTLWFLMDFSAVSAIDEEWHGPSQAIV